MGLVLRHIKSHLLHVLGQIPCHVPHEITEIVLVKHLVFGEPEADVLEARRVLRVRLERGYAPTVKLRKESRICRPEQANIWDGEQDHRDPFQSEAERPAYFVRYICDNVSAPFPLV